MRRTTEGALHRPPVVHTRIRSTRPSVRPAVDRRSPIRFVGSSVGLATWHALGTQAFGEVISADSL
jgi:hypothetical protein